MAIAEDVFKQPSNAGQLAGQSFNQGFQNAQEVGLKMRELDQRQEALNQQKQKHALEMQATQLAIADQGIQKFAAARMTTQPELKRIRIKQAEQFYRMTGNDIDPDVLKWAMDKDNEVQAAFAKALPEIQSADPNVRIAAYKDMMEILTTDPGKFAPAMQNFVKQQQDLAARQQRASTIALGQATTKEAVARIQAQTAENVAGIKTKAELDKAEADRKSKEEMFDKGLKSKEGMFDKGLKSKEDIEQRKLELRKKLFGQGLSSKEVKRKSDLTFKYENEARKPDNAGGIGTSMTMINEANKILAFAKDPEARKNGYGGDAVQSIYARLEDPKTGVREGEIKRLSKASGSKYETLKQAWEQFSSGQALTDQQWNSLGKAAVILGREGERQAEAYKTRLTPRIKGEGVNPNDVFAFVPSLNVGSRTKGAQSVAAPSASAGPVFAPNDPVRVQKALSHLMNAQNANDVGAVSNALGAKGLSKAFFESSLKRKLSQDEIKQLNKLGIK